MAEPETRIKDTPTEGQNLELASSIKEWSSKSFDLSQLPDLVKDVKSDDLHSQCRGVIGIKKLLDQKPLPIQEIIDSGVVPRFIEFLENNKEADLQVRTAGILGNLVSGTTQQTQAIIDLGGLSILIKLLRSPNKGVYKAVVFALGNIAADSTKYRDMILNQGALEYIVNILATAEDHSLIKDATFALSNLCTGKPAPKPSKISAAIPVLCGVIKVVDTYPEATLDATIALASISEADDQIQPVIATGVVPSLIKHLKGGDVKILVQCLKILGNIISGDDEQTEFVVSFPEFLPGLFQLAQHNKKKIRKEACWIVSNITAGNTNQINLVINNLQYVQVLTKIALTDDIDVKREAAWALSNATTHNHPSQIPQIIKTQIFDCLIDMLGNDAKLLKVTLEGIDQILSKWGKKEAVESGQQSEFVLRLEEKGGLGKIEGLQSHPNNEVYEASLKILQKHFDMDEQPNEPMARFALKNPDSENQFKF